MPTRRKYTPKRKFTVKKSTKPVRKTGTTRYRKPTTTKPAVKQSSRPSGSAGLTGFDRSIYKANEIIDTVGRGFGILTKPVNGVISLAREINPMKFFRK